MLRGLFDHFESKEAAKPPAPGSFASPPAARWLRLSALGRVAVALGIVVASVVLFFAPDLPAVVTTVLLVAVGVGVLALLVPATIAVARLAALERAGEDGPS